MAAIADDLQAAWELHAEELAKLPNVTTVGIGVRTRGGKRTKTPALVVGVKRKLSPEQLGPSSICPREVRLQDGRMVEVDVVEDPADFTLEADRATYRPVPGGCEIGAIGSGSVGTLGGWFCRRLETRSVPVWLTNAHVADPVNQAAVPADSRVVQPGAGSQVIGNTTDVVGYPSPQPAAGVTVSAQADAAIGRLDPDIRPDVQVLEIGSAPFEIGEATVGMGLQKRGRTSLLTDGTVTAPSGSTSPFVLMKLELSGGGFVTFGGPGNPRVMRVNADSTGLAAAFTQPGDSGSLYFAQQHGRLQTTFPCIGLHFAGTYRSVAASSNPNSQTVQSIGFDIGGIMSLWRLETVCACVLRSLLEAIFGRRFETRELAGDETAANVRFAERMMRSFRGGVLARSPVGRRISDAVSQTAPDVSRLLIEDPVAFGLAVEMLEPWATAATSAAVLNREIDARTIANARALADHVSRVAPDSTKTVQPMIDLLGKSEGRPVRKLLGRLTAAKLPKKN